MITLASHSMPTYSEESRADTLLHYTTGSGLHGILSANEIWSTAYYCMNDQSELSSGKNVLTPLFRNKTYQMMRSEDRRAQVIAGRGVDIMEYADKFEHLIMSFALNILCVYITCFCKPKGKEDFQHGLLSQWRGYGTDGGYALQLSRSKLEEFIDQVNKPGDFNYVLKDVYYSADNSLKDEVLQHSDAFINAYLDWLDSMVNWNVENESVRSPIADLPGGPLESLLDYLIHTKSEHFIEERECRMSVLGSVTADSGDVPVDYFTRNGLIVPYTKTPPSLNFIDCVEWIIVGPGPRISNRLNSVTQMVKKLGLNISVRPSHIPYSRA